MLKPLTSCLAAGLIAALVAAAATANAQSKVGQEPTPAGSFPNRLDHGWKPDCADGQRRMVKARFKIGPDGHLQGPVDTGGLDIQSDVGARRAVEAIHQAEPYAPAYRGLTLTVTFDPKKACAQHN